MEIEARDLRLRIALKATELANLKASVALHYANYNFVRAHRTLRCTPAMAAGVSNQLWSVAELIERAIGDADEHLARVS